MRKPACIILMAVLMLCSSCTTYRPKYCSFPIRILKGGADIAVTVIPTEQPREDEDDPWWLMDWIGGKKENRQAIRPSPSEEDYTSKIRLRDKSSGYGHHSESADAYQPFAAVNEYLAEGETFSMPVPRDMRVRVTITNKDTDELVFTCGKQQFLLQPNESKTLIFRY